MSLCGVEACEGVWDVEEEARRGGRGRKLQDPGARWETSVNISEMRRCWTDVSWVLLERGYGIGEGRGSRGEVRVGCRIS